MSAIGRALCAGVVMEGLNACRRFSEFREGKEEVMKRSRSEGGEQKIDAGPRPEGEWFNMTIAPPGHDSHTAEAQLRLKDEDDWMFCG